jgi:ABC-type proline/glycine betaine transport system permease subunit
MKKTKMWKALALLGTCSLIAIVYGVRYGWLAGHTHWVAERLSNRHHV